MGFQAGKEVSPSHGPQTPSIMVDSYLKMPQTILITAGNMSSPIDDIGFTDETGYLHFAEHEKDSFRHRGQNRSTFELKGG